MSYTEQNFQTKKALKEALARGEKIRCFQPMLGPSLTEYTGSVSLEGPHYPQPHKWYAQAILENGLVTKVS